MSFLYPLGLLGLIGIPVLIIIYLIKNKYTEQTVTSTYLWTLSERFLKRKKKDKKITGIISLILQILAVILISFTIAHPIITLPGMAKDLAFVIDASGSMNIKNGEGKTRFELAKEKIAEEIEDTVKGSKYTLVCVGSSTNTIYKNEENKETALQLLADLEPSHGTDNFIEAREIAQMHFNENRGTEIFLLTDKDFNVHENIEIINVSEKQDNYSVSDVTYEHGINGILTVEGKVVSYENDAKIDLELYIDDEPTPVVAQKIDAAKSKPHDFKLEIERYKFARATLKIKNEDALMLDNQVVIYNEKSENSYETLLVSDTPFFFETVLKLVGNADVEVMSTKEYLKKEEEKDTSIDNYGLYIFQSCNPRSIPKNGSVWLMGATASVENLGLTTLGEVTLDKPELLEKSKSTVTIVRSLLNGVDGNEIYVSKYTKYGASPKYRSLFLHNGNPMISTGTNNFGNRQVLFSFDLRDTDFALTADFVILVKNLLDYSFPVVLEETLYNCGEVATVNVLSNCDSIRVESPLGNISHISTGNDIGELTLNEVGTYKIVMTVGGVANEYHIYSAMAKDESVPLPKAEPEISVIGKATGKGIDGIFDNLMVYFIFLAVIFVADWVVYCYEKYQLR